MKYTAITLLAISLVACSDSIPVPVEPQQPQELPAISSPDEYQQKIRTVPYPRSCNEIFINPAPLIVPQNMADGEAVVFQLSSSPDFPADRTLSSKALKWNMFNPHEELSQGRWYWRFCNMDAAGNAGEWSDTYDFEVTAESPIFVTPQFDTFINGAPRIFPRLHCYTSATVESARSNISSHAEYKSLIQRAQAPLDTDFSNIASFYTKAEEFAQNVTWLYQAYYLTRQQEYADKLLLIYKSFTDNLPSDKVLYSSNFTTSNLLYSLAACYDICYTMIDSATRAEAAAWMADVICKNFDTFRGYEENHIFDNHFWQHNYRNFFQACILLYDDPVQGQRVMPMLEYLYELWTARAPAGGFNRDGLWHNGTGYFNANIQTLCYIPLMMSYITGCDYFRHPWYLNAGRALSFTTPPAGSNIGFGDGSETRQEPNHQIASFADVMAYQTGDAYASWYANRCGTLINRDYEMRIYRICRGPQNYSSQPDDRADMLQWNRDCGEVAMHSNIFDTSGDLALGFRSSTFGSGSHTTACQNAFNITFGGTDVFRSSGYYQNFSDAHNLMSYRHSRAHNTILVNGIGQPYSTAGWGRILRAGGGSSIAYALGDASHAYCGISDDPMWIAAFKAAGIEQTPEYGFGSTPLTKYLRHITMLGSDAIVIYDEIEASQAARIDWLLHSKSKFDISDDNTVVEVCDNALPYRAKVTFLCSEKLNISQTDKWAVVPAVENSQYPPQWHLSASCSAPKVRYLAIIQITPKNDEAAQVHTDSNSIVVGNWTIDACMDTAAKPHLVITNPAADAAIAYGSDPLEINGRTFARKFLQSTMIVEKVDGETVCNELTDAEPLSSRSR
ncbi:MAG: DUF4962 domain-containing protein [Muribaculaceae bacterium]|nr:DUF4962 domain-containing protein [Muribaculaceae bacterium]